MTLPHSSLLTLTPGPSELHEDPLVAEQCGTPGNVPVSGARVCAASCNSLCQALEMRPSYPREEDASIPPLPALGKLTQEGKIANNSSGSHPVLRG